MAETFPRVQPGDLITADLMNRILAALEGMDGRVTKLEGADSSGGGKAPVITGLMPSGQIRVGQDLTVLGKNFNQPAVNNIVTIDNVRIMQFRFASNDTQLSFFIPQVTGLPSQGKLVTLTVSHEHGLASTQFTLLPELTLPTGRVEVVYEVAPILPEGEPNILGNRSYIFGFSLTSFTDKEATYQVVPNVSGTGWFAQWLLDESQDGRTSDLITLPGNATDGVRKDLRIRVNVAQGATGTASFNVVATEISGGAVNPGQASLNLTIGSPPPVPDSRVKISLRSVTQAQIVGNRIQLQRNKPGAITFNLVLSAVGDYVFSRSLLNPNGWTSGGLSIPGVNNVPSEGINQDVSVILTPGPTAIETEFILMVQSTDANPPISVRYVQPMSIA